MSRPREQPPFGCIRFLRDPEGNVAEFSCAQGACEKARQVWGNRPLPSGSERSKQCEHG